MGMAMPRFGSDGALTLLPDKDSASSITGGAPHLGVGVIFEELLQRFQGRAIANELQFLDGSQANGWILIL
jgi:hypothetical protein